MRFLSFLAVMATVLAMPARADGGSGRVELPPPQPSVVVKIEKGVRVWRPITFPTGADTTAEVPASVASAEAASPIYYGGGGGLYNPYYAYGFKHGHRDRHHPHGRNPHVTLNGTAPFANRVLPQRPVAQGQRLAINLHPPIFAAPRARVGHGPGLHVGFGSVGHAQKPAMHAAVHGARPQARGGARGHR